jgi:glutamyl-tRNA reductase
VSRSIVLVGLSHHTAPVEVRERVAFANGKLEPALRGLVASPGVQEGVIVSTCNRVEVVVCGGDPDAVAAALPAFIARTNGLPDETLRGRVYTHRDREAVRHLFRVASSLDSMVVGEPQILGQLKEQYALAAALGASGRVLHRCFHRSFSVAKRIRSETGIAEKAVSVGSAAVQLACDIFDRFDDKTALLIGVGTMGEVTARQLLGRGVGTLMVANRTFERATDVARQLGGVAVPFEQVRRVLHLADLVICAAGGDMLIRSPQVEEARRERRGRPMLLIDLAVPRAVEPAVNDLDGVYLFDVDDLDGVIEENRGARATEALRAETIVDTEVDAFWNWLQGLDVVPTIVALRERLEAIRQREVERHVAALGAVDPRQREAIERLTRSIVNKILHDPVTALRRHQAERGESFYVEAARSLFRLAGDEPSAGDDSPDDEDP